jgi:D-arabinitol 4-dehydrogenase
MLPPPEESFGREMMRVMSQPRTWLHIGVGAFHRAHQAWYLDRLAQGRQAVWSLHVGNLLPDLQPVEAALAASGGGYTLETVTPEGKWSYERVRSIGRVIAWDERLDSLAAAGADSATRVISFTVTEAGYHLDQFGRVDLSRPEITADLNEARGASIYGIVARILAARASAGAPGVTLLSCDNLRDNGDRFDERLRSFLEAAGRQDLIAWAQRNVTVPNTMVDRITPRVTLAALRRIEAATGVGDPAAVSAEAFAQWVIEDRFSAGRPALEAVGVEMVASVKPHEDAKIRILNTSHAFLAWRGADLGLQWIHDCVARPELREILRRYVREDVAPCLGESPIDPEGYLDLVLARFGNPHIQDTVERVAADGFAKISSWLAPTVRERLASGARPWASAVMAVAFLRFLQRWRAGALAFAYRDQSVDLDRIRDMLASPDVVGAYCTSADLWGELAGVRNFVELMREAWLETGESTPP